MTRRLAATACLLALLSGGAGRADVIDDFEGLAPGAIHGQNGWSADLAAAAVGRDFTRGGNQFLRLGGADNDVYKSLGAASIPDGQIGTLFFRFMPTSSMANHGIGVTEVAAPTAWAHYRATALVINDGRNAKMQGRSGGSYIDLTLGPWNTTGASSWTSGFYPGMLWQTYARTGDSAWRDAAEARTAGIESQKTNDGTHDLGFMVGIPFGLGYELTGNAAYKDVVLTAAGTLATRYSPVVGAIQSWGNKTTGKYEVIIDNMMNLEMLFWASNHGGSASLYDLAVQHALTTMEHFVRPDGGTYHVVEFDRATGQVILKRTAQGYNAESTWSRGQAWGLYGFTMTYRETGDARFLETAQALADYFIANSPEAGVPYYDFDDPANQPPWDSSAAAIAASGLLELMFFVEGEDRQRYFEAAEQMLLTLAGPGFLSDGTAFESLLMQGTVAKTGLNRVGTSYGDYYFLEALGRYEAVPEPGATWLLGCAAAAGLVAGGRRRRSSR
jgi:unsaturated chondroitin disaccharide hydrolase